MELALNNLNWMSLNLGLAFLGLLFGWMFFMSKKTLFSIIFFILWVLFVPNTIYLITDLQHLPKQWVRVDLIPKIILILEYGVLTLFGIISFIISMYPVDKVFTELHLKRKKHTRFAILVLVNLFIAFALILGKFQRTHSWYVFTDFHRVLGDITAVFKTPILLWMVFFFGVVINLTYFGFKNIIQIKLSKQ